MDWTSGSDLWAVISTNALVPFIPIPPLVMARITATMIACSHHHWWFVLLIATLSGLPSIVTITWLLRYGSTLITRIFPKIDVPPAKSTSVFLAIFLLNCTPLPDYVTAAYAATTKPPWPKFLVAVTLARIVHILPVVVGGAAYGHWHQRLHPLWEFADTHRLWITIIGTIVGIVVAVFALRPAPQPTPVMIDDEPTD